MTAPISDEELDRLLFKAKDEAGYIKDGYGFDVADVARDMFAAGYRAALQEPGTAEDRAKVYAEIRGAVFREGIAHDRRLEVWLVDPYGEHPAQVHMPLIPWLNKTQGGEADTP